MNVSGKIFKCASAFSFITAAACVIAAAMIFLSVFTMQKIDAENFGEAIAKVIVAIVGISFFIIVVLGLAFLSALIYFLIGFYSKKYYNLSDEKCGKSIAGIICISLIPLIFPALMLSFSIVFSSLVNMSLIVLVYLSEGLCVLFAVGFAVLMITGMIKCAKEAKKKGSIEAPEQQ